MSVLEIKVAVRTRDDHRCTECGMTNTEHVSRYGKSLHVHRNVPGSEYTLDGCVTLCFRCHGPKPRRPPRSIPGYEGRLSVFVCPCVRSALKAEAGSQDVEMGDIINDLVQAHMAEQVQKAKKHRLAKEKKNKGP